MLSLINSAMSGLRAGQLALSTTSNNISNSQVPGYNRQNTILAQNNGTQSAAGFIGNGVTVTSVQREYDTFIANQLRTAQTQYSGISTYYQQISQIDNLLADSNNNLSATMQDFFTSLQNLAGNASDEAARTTVIGKAQGMVNQFQNIDKYLHDMDSGVNQKIKDNVKQINNYATQIAKLNDQITRLRGSSGSEPLALLDQRDQLVTELNQRIGVTVTQQDGQVYNVSFAGGLPLVQGTNAYQVTSIPASSDPSRLTLGYRNGAGTVVEINEDRLRSGTLGGAFKFRSEVLDSVRNELGQLALVMAESFNITHQAGFDLDGNAGGEFFSFNLPKAIANRSNTGDAVLTVAYDNANEVKASDYTVKFIGGDDWQITRISDNAIFDVQLDEDDFLNFEGVVINVANDANLHDSFTVKTVSGITGSLSVEITDTSEIAAAGAADGGVSDNRNARALLALQIQKLVEGTASLSEAYAATISVIGSHTNTTKINSSVQGNIVKQLNNEQQSLSGVNLDEEYGNLQRFQQYYLANAQVMRTAETTFNALLGVFG